MTFSGFSSGFLPFTLVLALVGCSPVATSPTGVPVNTAPVPSDSPPSNPTIPAATGFQNSARCGECHPMHDAEWRGSVMHYAAASPVFNAFELTMEKLTDGMFAPDGSSANFCAECHAPTGVFDGEIPAFAANDPQPLVAHLSDDANDGLTCDFCHTVTGPRLEGSVLGDGIANFALDFGPSAVKQGPIADPRPNPFHAAAENTYLSDSAFCGSCHDVRLPAPDVVTGEPFQRLENLFSEWESGPYNSSENPLGRVVSCQDCHMSLYPFEPPGTYPQVAVAETTPDQIRKHTLHAFTAVSIPLVDDPRFPNVDTGALDRFGYPLGQEQRRTALLQAAVEIEPNFPTRLRTDSETLHLELMVTNVGAGHRVPAGFSQEREVWLEVEVRDALGTLYRSGFLEDRAHPETGEMVPDGRLHDEDLQDHHFDIDLETFATVYHSGPDRNQRPAVNLGLVNFQNHFVRVNPDGSRDRVLNPLEANSMDNSHSLPILEPVSIRYDVPMPKRDLVGAVEVEARLRYRSFPPEFLRFLAQREPELVSEDTVDRNTIVDMVHLQERIEIE